MDQEGEFIGGNKNAIVDPLIELPRYFMRIPQGNEHIKAKIVTHTSSVSQVAAKRKRPSTRRLQKDQASPTPYEFITLTKSKVSHN